MRRNLLLVLIRQWMFCQEKLKDILAQKEKGVIQVDSDCIVVEAARKMRDNKVGALMVLEKRRNWLVFLLNGT